jgi:hypothetical protein
LIAGTASSATCKSICKSSSTLAGNQTGIPEREQHGLVFVTAWLEQQLLLAV